MLGRLSACLKLFDDDRTDCVRGVSTVEDIGQIDREALEINGVVASGLGIEHCLTQHPLVPVVSRWLEPAIV